LKGLPGEMREACERGEVMRHSSVPLSIPFLVAVVALLASAARAQSYGPEEQVLTIGAAEFRSLHSVDTYIDASGYLRYNGDLVHLAPLSLPEGARIEKLCLYAHDSDLDPSKFERSHVVAIKLAPGGESLALKVVSPDVVSENDGYHRVCRDGPVTLRAKIDMDGDGTRDAVAYYVHVEVPSPRGSLGVGGVQISWKRQVSHPPSTPTFGDVPAADIAFEHIEALAASGVTAGCGGGNFCPNATLTRREMAIFLTKALGLHWAD
jgi:hypothetical protein